MEVEKVLPLLTAPESTDSPAFHVVAYSLPGFGFSEGPTKQGFAAKQHAEVGHRLMLSLGYKEYGERHAFSPTQHSHAPHSDAR